MGLLTPLAVRVGALGWLPEYLPWIVKVDDGIQKVSGGRVDLLTIAGLPSVTMLIPGRKSGIERSTTVLAAPVGDEWIVAGSYFGGPKTPAWVYNLRAAETIDVEIKGRRVPMSRRELDGDDRAQAWQTLRGVWPNFDLYEQRTADRRRIPLFRLSPA
ncbi:nitroreductase family deazaflavin-dependent oxidoreductase [Gordonia sp. (in: high G+C Gram-positive bacteria)]|uniref:nitroreductase family deazaflavin-dependent oxidoreductase n=1 Tax=Gordonia sp. (in: high G+C Gram-positive bacteria) TaxID=84139 RepID=UPI0026300ABE|nr:nitroreductase family deazaflavin-dependent oxidoreductase [Gordonia sp. (in: high G+C Gram-positive bacteria)]